ncbi:general secretion pathway protein J [Catenovulum agarivorans DS-2]|uniref:Type II secretion system protein J n=1 Tax=Catenovulum agarivorans DS-2 TaxID=1328313 RepID=W7QHA2_9ALTE|nr:type II secretion system minor pseudopilin GspJ [Catenovulum agarivorans]EWH11236.1 general secretion pathway protein J [Catenovulum agarivorans DS-2]
MHARIAQGFTLIEMLLAITIFALLGVAGFNILSSTTTANDISMQHGEKLAQLQRAMLIIERDFSQLSRRSVRIMGEAPQHSYLSHGELILDSDSQVLAFRRNGWTNPNNLLPRSEIQSVAYRIVEENLERMHFLHPDPVKGEDPKERVLLEGVEAIEFEFYDRKTKSWVNKWQQPDLPAGISISLKTLDFGEIKRVFAIAGGES